MDDNQKFTMKFVAQQTGLTTHAIRVWEKRYATVVPTRTASNRRLYSIGDLRRLKKLAKITKAGHNIGQVAKLSDIELEKLCKHVSSSSEPNRKPKKIADTNIYRTEQFAESESCIRSCVEAINRMNARKLSDLLQDAENSLGLTELLVSVVDPLITRLSTTKERDGASIARNSFASSILRSLLSRKFTKKNPGQSGPLLLTTTPTGQWEEVGAVLVDLLGRSLGWRSLYLGPDLPADDLILAAAQNTPSAISVIIAEHRADNTVAEELIKIRDGVKNIPLLVGGHASSGYAKLIRDIGGRHFFDLSHLGEELLLLNSRESL
tara:strand:- start:618 stop:1583 length:966 start_codon:yes stop_codon:yes gene_type:complete